MYICILLYLGLKDFKTLHVGNYVKQITCFLASCPCRRYVERLVASQKGRSHPSPEFRKDKNMRLYKVFKHVEHKSTGLNWPYKS